MVSPKLSDSFERETGADDGGAESGVDYLEAIALLQEEVARLEEELRWRDQGPSETASNGAASAQDEIESAAAAQEVAAARAEIERLEADLAGREETIGLLLDQLSRVEESHAASRAEWEQLAGWLAELEQRVEGQDGERAAPGSGGEVIEALRSENLRLRAACEELAKRPTAEPAAQTGEAQRDEMLKERDALHRQLEQIQDDRRREQLEHSATLAELQAQLSRASLARPNEPPPEAEKGPEKLSGERDAELRFRALRQHLVEIHQREEEERKQKQLIPRLSRLWSRTGPR